MNSDLEAYLHGPERCADASYTALLRQALGEILKLSADVVDPLVAQLEKEYEVTRKRTQLRFDMDKDEVENEQRDKSERLRVEYEARVEDIRAEYEGQLSDTKVDAQHRRKKLNQSAADLEEKAEKNSEEMVMVAEFVAEGAVTRYKQKQVETKTAHDSAQQYLEGLSMQATRFLHRYRQPEVAAQEVAPVSEAADQPYAACQTLVEQQLEALGHLRIAQLFARANVCWNSP